VLRCRLRIGGVGTAGALSAETTETLKVCLGGPAMVLSTRRVQTIRLLGDVQILLIAAVIMLSAEWASILFHIAISFVHVMPG
jgi:hypothetical protein